MDTIKDLFNNKYVVGFLTVGTVLYASLASPALPSGLAQLFDYPLVKMLVYGLIVLLMTQNLQVAIVVAIAFYVLMSLLRVRKITEGFIDAIRTEGFFAQQGLTEEPILSTADELPTEEQLQGRIDRFCQSSRHGVNCDQLKEHVNILCGPEQPGPEMPAA